MKLFLKYILSGFCLFALSLKHNFTFASNNDEAVVHPVKMINKGNLYEDEKKMRNKNVKNERKGK